MPPLLNHIDPDGLEEFSVVFSDRSLNHMSLKFQTVMRDLSTMLKEVYQASAIALIPGGVHMRWSLLRGNLAKIKKSW